VPRGTPDQVASIMSDLTNMGVGRFYVQQYAALDDVDTDALTPVISALRG